MLILAHYYHQACDIITENTTAIIKACAELKISEADFETFLQEEHAYLINLKKECISNPLHIDYLKALDNCTVMR
jgi:hypothetical protein